MHTDDGAGPSDQGPPDPLWHSMPRRSRAPRIQAPPGAARRRRSPTTAASRCRVVDSVPPAAAMHASMAARRSPTNGTAAYAGGSSTTNLSRRGRGIIAPAAACSSTAAIARATRGPSRPSANCARSSLSHPAAVRGCLARTRARRSAQPAASAHRAGERAFGGRTAYLAARFQGPPRRSLSGTVAGVRQPQSLPSDLWTAHPGGRPP